MIRKTRNADLRLDQLQLHTTFPGQRLLKVEQCKVVVSLTDLTGMIALQMMEPIVTGWLPALGVNRQAFTDGRFTSCAPAVRE